MVINPRGRRLRIPLNRQDLLVDHGPWLGKATYDDAIPMLHLLACAVETPILFDADECMWLYRETNYLLAALTVSSVRDEVREMLRVNAIPADDDDVEARVAARVAELGLLNERGEVVFGRHAAEEEEAAEPEEGGE